jgi:hypothetical protein
VMFAVMGHALTVQDGLVTYCCEVCGDEYCDIVSVELSFYQVCDMLCLQTPILLS